MSLRCCRRSRRNLLNRRFGERPLPGIGAYIGRHPGYVIGRVTVLGGGGRGGNFCYPLEMPAATMAMCVSQRQA